MSGPGFHMDADDELLTDAVTRACAGAPDAAAAVDGLGCLVPIGEGLSLTDAALVVRTAARCSLAYPLVEALVLVALRGDGGRADDLRAAFGSGAADTPVAPVVEGTHHVLVLDEAATVVHRVSDHGAPRDPLQATGWHPRVEATIRHNADLRAIALTLLAARMSGTAEGLLARTIGHLSDRRQFGRPLGSFQALRHRAAQDWIAVQDMQAASDLAAVTWDTGDRAGALALAQIAKATAAEAGPRVAENCIHVHGAMGFTWDAGLLPGLVSLRHDAVAVADARQLFAALGGGLISNQMQEGATA